MVGRMSLSVGLDVGQGWTILLLWNPVQGEGGLVYALVGVREGGLFRPFTQKWHLMPASYTAPKSSAPHLGKRWSTKSLWPGAG